MATNPFTALKDFVDQPKRNTFDLSFQNNLTLQFGKLYPVFCKEVIPGDSFRISPTFGLRAMPMVFPVQTRMNANLHFFYVRNRNLWKDWPDFIGRTKKNLVPPYLSPANAKRLCVTNGLGDYFGCPTTISGGYGSVRRYLGDDFLFKKENSGRDILVNYAYKFSSSLVQSVAGGTLAQMNTYTSMSSAQGNTFGVLFPVLDLKTIGNVSVEQDQRVITFRLNHAKDFTTESYPFMLFGIPFFVKVGDEWVLKAAVRPSSTQQLNFPSSSYGNWIRSTVQDSPLAYRFREIEGNNADLMLDINLSILNYEVYSLDNTELTRCDGLESLIETLISLYGTSEVRVGFWTSSSGTGAYNFTSNVQADNNQIAYRGPLDFSYKFSSNSIYDISFFGDTQNPYYTGDLKISALPFRAYESIYNAFYRNQFNDPFKINGQIEYNKFITTDTGGPDSTMYDLFNRNWEMDFLTSAKQNPVDGDITPLVGVTGAGTFTFQNSDGTQYNITPEYAQDGTTIIGLKTVQGTPENNSAIRRLMDMATVGISINDFRNVNALQRWLETNLRRGYRYKDQIMSHFGVDVKYDVLDMPEFIGGMSEPVLVNQISQTVDNSHNDSGNASFKDVLGSYAGQASVLAQSNHDISKYCDEHGFIIGILSITPVPNYSQLLPKMFLKDNVLDYYFPEFGHIGNQPIPYSEVCPLESFAAGDRLTDVFGYQRAWYDLLASVDEVHGDFRTSLDGFLINRVFNGRPELGKEFIEVSNDEINNPFSVTDTDTQFMGQIYFNVTAQRPIPKYGIPRLE